MTRTAFALQTTPQVNEPELIARVLAGDRLAGRELYNAHAPRVFRLAYRLTGDAELAREVVPFLSEAVLVRQRRLEVELVIRPATRPLAQRR